ncbi:MAG: AraC family transcriptional regulator [Alistipes sp.]|nr:AraC family transcriptional regulator [Alistipes sp.]
MDEKLSITKIKREAYHNMRQAHFHEKHEIYYLISGERNFTINDQVFRIGKGDLVIIPAGELHRTTYFGNNTHERVAIMFSDSIIEDIYASFGREYVTEVMNHFFIHIPDGRRTYVEDLMNRMLYEAEEIDELSDYMKKLYFHELMVFVIRCYKNRSQGRELDVANDIIQNAAKYIYENSDKNIGLNDVADKFGMSSSYFSKKFKAITGFGFKEYLVGVRIKEASNMLLTTDKSITEIAISCGFNDSNYFGDAFRRVKGVSPHKYRKNNGAV